MGPCACSTPIPARPSSAAAPDTASLSERAPCDPPNTRIVGACGSSPKCARALARSAARSSVVIARRSGIPITGPSSPLPGTAAATAAAWRAPTLFAIPALALASCTTTGTREPGRRAAR